MPEFTPVDFTVPVGPHLHLLEATVYRPDGAEETPCIHDNSNCTVTLSYRPSESGEHLMSVIYDGQPVPGSPFHFTVQEQDYRKIKAYGPGLHRGKVGIPSTFFVDMKKFSEGKLKVAVEGPAKPEMRCHSPKNDTCKISYVPPAPGDYYISIKFEGRHVKGSPFLTHIAARREGVPGSRNGDDKSDSFLKLFQFNADVSHVTELMNLAANVISPSGEALPCTVYQSEVGTFEVAFLPLEEGEHLVYVTHNQQLLTKAPFPVQVTDHELGNPSKVRISGAGLVTAGVGCGNQFLVDPRRAGYGGIRVAVEGPGHVNLTCEEHQDRTSTVTWCPEEPGEYLVHVLYAERPVPGSPFHVPASAPEPEKHFHEMKPNVAHDVRISMQQSTVRVGQVCELTMIASYKNLMTNYVSAQVTSPQGFTSACKVMEDSSGEVLIRFVPRDAGVHRVNILVQGQIVVGCPYLVWVKPGRYGRVTVGGTGLNQGLVNTDNFLEINLESGRGGELAVTMQGPSKAEISAEPPVNGTCLCRYQVTRPGQYWLSVQLNKRHITGSPFKIRVLDEPDVAQCDSQLMLSNLAPLNYSFSNYKVNRPAAVPVTCQSIEATSKHVTFHRELDEFVLTPSGFECSVVVQPSSADEKTHEVHFIPTEVGAHFLFIRSVVPWPFLVLVAPQFQEEENDLPKVWASGYGLKLGIAGQPNHFFVHTSESSSGMLSVDMDGPSKAELTFSRSKCGIIVSYTVDMPGDYKIAVQTAGHVHIPQSPFQCTVNSERPSSAKDTMELEQHQLNCQMLL